MNRATFQTEIFPLYGEVPLPTIEWMKQRQLLPRVMKCDTCNDVTNWTKHRRVTDKYVWRCQYKNCLEIKRFSSNTLKVFCNITTQYPTIINNDSLIKKKNVFMF